jgi:hypothetical protein
MAVIMSVIVVVFVGEAFFCSFFEDRRAGDEVGRAPISPPRDRGKPWQLPGRPGPSKARGPKNSSPSLQPVSLWLASHRTHVSDKLVSSHHLLRCFLLPVIM